MFAKKQLPPEPKAPEPPILQISGPEDPDASIVDVFHPYAEQESNDRLVQAIIAEAFHEGADQVSLTPAMYALDENALEVQYLIAGEWRNTFYIPIRPGLEIALAFKTLAGLPLWEHRMVLEGLIVVRYGAADYDVHLSITPTRHGEKITLLIETAEEFQG